MTRVLVTGGAGYVGSVLVPKLVAAGHDVTVYDLFLFGDHLGRAEQHPGHLTRVHADIRDEDRLRHALRGQDLVLHLACISNDPSFALDPQLSRTINYDCFGTLVACARSAGVSRFIYASTSSVYGVSDAPDVTEEHPLVPLTDYNKYKGLCEPILLTQQSPEFTTVVIRPATICGWSPRLRLDLTVNILTVSAVTKGKITVFGGSQKRPNLHIEDMTDLYVRLVDEPAGAIAGQIFNVGYQNHTIAEIAEIVRRVVAREFPDRADLAIETTPTSDVRSYHISSEKIKRVLGFVPRRTVEDAVRDLCAAFRSGSIPEPGDKKYYNLQTIMAAGLK